MFSMTKILAGVMSRARGMAGRAAVTILTLLALSACGQKGALYLPTGPAAAQRATLLQTLRPGQSAPVAPGAPALPASAASLPATTP